MSEVRYILHIVPKLELGGIGTMIYNYYVNMDRNKYIFDFVVHGESIEYLESDFKAMGSEIFHVTPKKESFKKYKEDLTKAMTSKKYYAIHAHQNLNSFIPLGIAKKLGYERTIAHAHAFVFRPTSKEKLEHALFPTLTKNKAKYLLYCGELSRQWVYGKKKNDRMIWIPNGIDLEKFRYSIELRNQLRKELNLKEDTLVILTVSRLSVEKNIQFVLKIMEQVKLKQKNIHYVNIGTGELKDELKALTERMQLEDYVTFLGPQRDIAKYYNIADCYLLPSLFEAFPVSAIEAQANGCPSILSDNISDEVILNDNVCKLGINDESISQWLDKIESYGLRKDYEINDSVLQFDCVKLAEQLQHWYDEIE